MFDTVGVNKRVCCLAAHHAGGRITSQKGHNIVAANSGSVIVYTVP